MLRHMRNVSLGLSIIWVFGLVALSLPARAADQEEGGAFKKKTPTTRSNTATPSRRLGGCVVLTVAVPRTKPDGRKWDVKGENNQIAPDIFITNTATGQSSPVCKNTYSCRWVIRNATGTLSLRVTDKDVVAHDLIGRGQCSLHTRACRLGRVRVVLSGC